MNKSELGIILNKYCEIYTLVEKGYDKNDAKRELKNLLDRLGLKKSRYDMENKVISEIRGFKPSEIEAYSMIFDDFSKYHVYVNYNIEEIETYFDVLQYEMNMEQIKCNNARLKYLKEFR